MQIISQLLRSYRKLNALTQIDVVNDMARFSDYFSGLNIVTLSRWETGKTKPSLKKKQEILKFLYARECFSHPECEALIKERYTYLQEVLEKRFDRNFRHLIGDFPELASNSYTVSNWKDFKNKRSALEQIININAATRPEGYPALSPEVLESWFSHPSSFVIICEFLGQHAGHYILLKVKNTVAKDIAYHRRNATSLTPDDFCTPEEKGTYQIFAFFSRSGKVAALMNIAHYTYLIKNIQTIDNIMIFSTMKGIVDMTRDYGIKVLASGKDEEMGYDWHGLLSPLEDILFTDTIIQEIY